jgi:hypothetical protein
MKTEVDQRLVDAIFAYGAYEMGKRDSKNYPADANAWREPTMEWVASNLRAMGVDTKPMGSSWGVIKN